MNNQNVSGVVVDLVTCPTLWMDECRDGRVDLLYFVILRQIDTHKCVMHYATRRSVLLVLSHR